MIYSFSPLAKFKVSTLEIAAAAVELKGSSITWRKKTRGPWALTLCLITLTIAVSTLSCMTNNAPNNLQNHSECYKVRHPIYVLLVSQSPKFKSVLLHVKTFWDKCIERPPKHFALKGQGYPIYLLRLGTTLKFYCFGLRRAIFSLSTLNTSLSRKWVPGDRQKWQLYLDFWSV